MDSQDTQADGGRPLMATRQRRRTTKIAEMVAREILHDIADRELAPGTKLPHEVEMVEKFDVARASLREALRILEIYGLIRIKPGPGGGPVVAEIDSTDLAQSLTFYLHASGATFGEVMQARLAIEPLMARQAAERADAGLHAALREGVDQAEDVIEGTDGEYLAVATGFHDAITSASGNKVLDLLARSLKEIYVDRVGDVIYRPAERQKLLQDHELVADAILSGDGDKAEALMRDHMVEYVEIFEQRFPGLMDETIDWF
jgi:GntR family transcriptional repressor for pyruvate dehydrogenase complex